MRFKIKLTWEEPENLQIRMDGILYDLNYYKFLTGRNVHIMYLKDGHKHSHYISKLQFRASVQKKS